VGILTDSHDINDECDNEANEKHQLSSKEILCILFPFEVNYYLDRLSLKNSCIFLSFLHQHYRRLSMYIHFQPLIIQLHQINRVVLDWKRTFWDLRLHHVFTTLLDSQHLTFNCHNFSLDLNQRIIIRVGLDKANILALVFLIEIFGNLKEKYLAV
jgi:hypothetical protein